MSETVAAPALKPKRRQKTNAAAPVAPVANIAAAVPGPTPEQLQALYEAMDAEERNKIIVGFQQRGNLQAAYHTVINALLQMGHTFEEGIKPLMIIALNPDDEDDEGAIYIGHDGEVQTNDDLADDDEDEDGGDEDEDADAPRKRGRPKGSPNVVKRGPGRPPSLIKALREYMSEKSVTQGFIAEKIGVTQAAVSHWLNTGNEPTNGNAMKLRKLVAHYLP